MQIVVIGGAGILGQALVKAVVERGALTRSDGTTAPVRRVIAVDRVQPPRLFVESHVEYVRADVDGPRLLQAVMGTHTDSVFHVWDAGAGGEGGSAALAASLRDVFETCALQTARPKLVLASSFAAEGLPGEPATDAPHALPATEDGLTALVGELVLAEAARRQGVDGRALRLGLIAGAPGPARFLVPLLHAAQQGADVKCPIPRDQPMWLTSASVAARALVHAHELPHAVWARAGVVNAPACTFILDELFQALSACCGRTIEPPPLQADPELCDMLAQHPARAAVANSLMLGFEGGANAHDLVCDVLASAGSDPD